jgi:hypothetical protein
MKHFLPLLFAFLSAALKLNAQTNIGGVISANTTYNLAGSPYTVTSTLSVNSGVTLAVQPGVVVRFNNGVGMTVNGTLSANGATFTSSSASPTRGIWSNISFGSGSAGISTIKNSTINFASSISVASGYTLNIDTTTIAEFSGSPLNVSGTVTCRNTIIQNSNSRVNVASSGSLTCLNNTSIQNMGTSEPGVVLTSGSVFSFTNSSISGCQNPITLIGTANLTLGAGASLANNNAQKAIIVNFSSMSSNWTLPGAEVAYLFNSAGFTVNSGATFTVGNQAVLKFQIGGFLTVNGTLNANAGSGNAIFFTSLRDDNWGGDSNGDASATTPARNDWTGVLLNTGSNSSVLRRVQQRFANRGVEINNANPTIDFSQFEINTHGISLLNASAPTITNTTIGSSSSTPVAMSIESDPVFTNNTFIFSDNNFDAIGLFGGTLSLNGTVRLRSVTSIPNMTYVMLGNILVPAGRTLTIEPGVVIKTQNSSLQRINVQGTLIANGTSTLPIVFTSVRDDNFGNPADTNKDGSSSSPTINDFGSITFETGSTGNSMQHCIVRFASGSSNVGNFSGAALNFISSGGTVRDCEFFSVNNGINCFLSSNPTIQDNNFVNLAYPLTVSAAANPTLIGCTFTNVTRPAIGLIGADVNSTTELSVSGTVSSHNFGGFTNITYVLRNNIRIANGTNITIAAGVVIKAQNTSFYVNGGLRVDGSAGNPVVFTSFQDDNFGNPQDTNDNGILTAPSQGEGPGIYFSPTSNDVFCNTNFLNSYFGGSPFVSGIGTGVILINSANPTINNTLLSNLPSSTVGIGVFGDGAPVVSNTTFSNGSYVPVSMSVFSNPTFTNISLTSMGYSGILLNDNNITSNATLNTRAFAGNPNTVYLVFSSVTVNAGVTLNVSPSVIMKFKSGCNRILISGNLQINAGSASPVIMTAETDDSAGGDTNNDGIASAPGVGNWAGLIFNSSSAGSGNIINGLDIRFAGGACLESNLSAIKFSNTGGTLNNVTISFTGACIGIEGGIEANPNLTNVTMLNSTIPVRMAMFSNPTFGAISLANITRTALHIPATTYSQDGTFIIRNFAGFNNITYVLEGTQTINSGTTITIPEGMVVKATSSFNYFNVNGRLNVNGTNTQPAIFTALIDDGFGNPADTENNGVAASISRSGTPILFNDISNDNSSINFLTLRYFSETIRLESAAPTINNCLFDQCNTGVTLAGNSSPVLTNNTFRNLSTSPVRTSIVTFASNFESNILEGTTFRVIEILNETLSQFVTLTKRDFGGIANIPYYFTGFTVGVAGDLNLEWGLTTKWASSSSLNINRSLIATGGFRADSNIVFTHIADDFYGGDNNANASASQSGFGSWGGIIFSGTSLSNLCSLSNCIIRFADRGIETTNASPTILNTAFVNCNTAVWATGSSNPVVNFCDFYNISPSGFGVNNANLTFNINAENCWWGSNNGPTHAANLGGDGTRATNQVDYIPFRTTGPNTPLAGDVSLNGATTAFDAALILQDLVGLITLTQIQRTAGDVSGASGLTSFDASLILQLSVGLINLFPSELRIGRSDVSLHVHEAEALPGEFLDVPVSVENVLGLMGSYGRIIFDTTKLEFHGIFFEELGLSAAYHTPEEGEIRFAMAGVSPLEEDLELMQLRFRIRDGVSPGTQIPLIVSHYIGNEADLTEFAVNGLVSVSTITSAENIEEASSAAQIYPNPAGEQINIRIKPNSEAKEISISLFDISGRLVMEEVHRASAIQDGLLYLDVRHLSAGQYLLGISQDAHKETRLIYINR